MKSWLFIFCFFPFLVSAHTVEQLPHDGQLRLFHSHSGELLETRYQINGVLVPEEMKKISHFMRSRDSGEVIPISSDLIILLDHLQDQFEADTVEIICGYRTEKFNRDLQKSGRGVANESFHTQGIAADIHLDEIKEKDLKDYLQTLNLGGIGYYPDLLMVHADLGPKRFWQEGTFTDRKNIGLFNEASLVQIQTNHLFYSDIDQQVLTGKNLMTRARWSLQFFHRGHWVELRTWTPDSTVVSSINSRLGHPMTTFMNSSSSEDGFSKLFTPMLEGLKERGASKSGLPFGKYRWDVDGSSYYQSSNEFYIKKNFR